jgi:hypothetical protein
LKVFGKFKQNRRLCFEKLSIYHTAKMTFAITIGAVGVSGHRNKVIPHGTHGASRVRVRSILPLAALDDDRDSGRTTGGIGEGDEETSG